MVLAPRPGQPGQRYLVFRFTDEAARERWTHSAEWTALAQEAATFSTPQVQTATGLETWFVLPDQSVVAPIMTPPKWKMFVMILLSAYVIGLVVIPTPGRFLRDWPFFALNILVTVCLGYLLTYVGLPLSTRIVHAWLYPQQRS
jgi:antibiotic biosynthesis monooxygenase (ABM) superfamily enzyme